VVDRTFTGNGRDVKTKGPKRVGPSVSDDGNTVVESKSKRDDCAGGNGNFLSVRNRRSVSRDTIPGDPVEVARRAREILELHWREPGFCVPNATTYPWQWLWDSCFHSICWAHLGEAERARTELANVLAHQAGDGFVPHMTYWQGGDTHAAFWGRKVTSSITQPPMYGHAVAELTRLGVNVGADTIERARRGLRFLIDQRMRLGTGIVIVHPWESGCDDSPRWDGWIDGSWTFERGKALRGELAGALIGDTGRALGATSSPIGSNAFEVASAGFSALVSFNAAELASVTGDQQLESDAVEIAAALDQRWNSDRMTWTDRVGVGPSKTAAVRTLDALLGILVTTDESVRAGAWAEIDNESAFAADVGPASTHRLEPSFDLRAYWRGPAWPQLTYLFWVAAKRQQLDSLAARLGNCLVNGALRSDFAEYWQPDTGEGLGAIPQSWTALAAVVSAQAPLAN